MRISDWSSDVCSSDLEVMRAALQRAAILSNEEYRGVRLEVSPGQLKINAHNPEQEEAQEEVEADTKVDDLAVGFNVNYMLDALSALRDENVVIALVRKSVVEGKGVSDREELGGAR